MNDIAHQKISKINIDVQLKNVLRYFIAYILLSW